jgi:hypothetical protein
MSVINLSDLDLSSKRVLIRQDLNVPIKDGVVTSDKRIKASLPTIEMAMKQGAKVMLMSHRGRPVEGEASDEFTLQPVADRLTELLGVTVRLETNWLDGVDMNDGEVYFVKMYVLTRAKWQMAMTCLSAWQRCVISLRWTHLVPRTAHKLQLTVWLSMRQLLVLVHYYQEN